MNESPSALNLTRPHAVGNQSSWITSSRSFSSRFCTSALRRPAESHAGSALPTEERLYTLTALRLVAGASLPPLAAELLPLPI